MPSRMPVDVNHYVYFLEQLLRWRHFTHMRNSNFSLCEFSVFHEMIVYKVVANYLIIYAYMSNLSCTAVSIPTHCHR